jgi:hypothetical protein
MLLFIRTFVKEGYSFTFPIIPNKGCMLKKRRIEITLHYFSKKHQF